MTEDKLFSSHESHLSNYTWQLHVILVFVENVVNYLFKLRTPKFYSVISPGDFNFNSHLVINCNFSPF